MQGCGQPRLSSTRGCEQRGRGSSRLERAGGRQAHAGVSVTATAPITPPEYLRRTYLEVSNADRSSALGLRLNQQNKTEKRKRILRERSCGRGSAPRAAQRSGSQAGREGGERFSGAEPALPSSPSHHHLLTSRGHQQKQPGGFPPRLLLAEVLGAQQLWSPPLGGGRRCSSFKGAKTDYREPAPATSPDRHGNEAPATSFK